MGGYILAAAIIFGYLIVKRLNACIAGFIGIVEELNKIREQLAETNIREKEKAVNPQEAKTDLAKPPFPPRLMRRREKDEEEKGGQ